MTDTCAHEIDRGTVGINIHTSIDKITGEEKIVMPERSIWMCTTRRCNLSCTYCYQGSHAVIPGGLSHFMPIEIATKAMEWSHKWGAGPLQVIWYGGEPLLGYKSVMKDLVPKWTAARRAMKLPPVSHSVTTNGTLLTPEVREWMDEVKMGMLLSLDGPQRFHDKSRPYYDKHSSWNDIKPEGILKWRPHQEIAWQLDPKNFDPATGAEQITPAVVDEMIALGFHNIAFNINWMDEWNEVARWNLQWLFKHITILMLERQKATEEVAALEAEAVKIALQGDAVTSGNSSYQRLRNMGHIGLTQDLIAKVEQRRQAAATKGLGCNWFGKLQRALTVDSKMSQPCGTGLNMVGVSPEGWLYPSQEMVYTVTQPNRAPGTLEYYRLGDLNKDPVLDLDRLTLLAEIKTSQMKPPAPFDCNTCVAHSASIGGCHCRYVGDYQAGQDVSNRFQVTKGYCQSTIAVHTGMLMGASVARYIRPDGWQGVQFHGSMQQRSGEQKAHVHTNTPKRTPTMDEMAQTVNKLMDRLAKLEKTNGA